MSRDGGFCACSSGDGVLRGDFPYVAPVKAQAVSYVLHRGDHVFVLVHRLLCLQGLDL